MIEMLIAMAIAGIVVIGTGSLLQSAMKTTSSLALLSDQVALVTETNGIISNKAACKAALVGTHVAHAYNLQLSSNIRAGAPYGKLQISSIQLVNVGLTTGNVYQGDIEIQGSPVTGAGSGHGQAPTFVRDSRFYFMQDQTGTIVDCVTEVLDPVVVCANEGGAWDQSASFCDFCSTLGGSRMGSQCILRP